MDKKQVLDKIKELQNQREESEEIRGNKSYCEGWEDGYDDALDRIKEFIEE